MNNNLPPDLVTPGSEEDEFAIQPRLGQLMKHYRQRAGLTQRDLERLSGVDQSKHQ